MNTPTRVPPHNEEAERSLLGAVMLDQAVLDQVMSQVSPDDFYREKHRIVFEAMVALFDREEPIDAITLSDHLTAEDKLDAVGGADFLAKLSNEVPSAANATHYGSIVSRKSALREFISTANSLVHESYGDVSDVDEFMDKAERQLFSITKDGTGKDYESMRDVIKEAYTEIENLYERDSDGVTGVPSGFVDLDEMTSGWQDSNLIILAARPAMGKTSLALNMAAHSALRADVPTAFFSLEMQNVQLAQRMLCSEARVDQTKLRSGTVSSEEWENLVKAAGSLSDAKLYLDETPALSIMEFRSKCRRMKSEHDIGLVFIDYLQLMQGSGGHDIREQEISEISRGLKGVAKELDIPVIALAQLNRGVESRSDKRPRMSDLRESGAIEQDADIITFIYRDEFYNPDTEDKGIAEIIIGKHRNGPSGTVRLRFFKSITKFENLAEDMK